MLGEGFLPPARPLFPALHQLLQQKTCSLDKRGNFR